MVYSADAALQPPRSTSLFFRFFSAANSTTTSAASLAVCWRSFNVLQPLLPVSASDMGWAHARIKRVQERTRRHSASFFDELLRKKFKRWSFTTAFRTIISKLHHSTLANFLCSFHTYFSTARRMSKACFTVEFLWHRTSCRPGPDSRPSKVYISKDGFHAEYEKNWPRHFVYLSPKHIRHW